jgi:hypothetical protein
MVMPYAVCELPDSVSPLEKDTQEFVSLALVAQDPNVPLLVSPQPFRTSYRQSHPMIHLLQNSLPQRLTTF